MVTASFAFDLRTSKVDLTQLGGKALKQKAIISLIYFRLTWLKHNVVLIERVRVNFDGE